MKKDVWQKTSNEMELQSFQFSWQQCEQKWKNLTKTYRDTVDHNRKSGNDRQECAYFKEPVTACVKTKHFYKLLPQTVTAY
jgi:hypothetical protein